MAVGYGKSLVWGIALLAIAAPALAQNSDTNQDDPVRIHSCAWLTTPVDDTSWLVLGSAWAGSGSRNGKATQAMAAKCIHAAPEAMAMPQPCPGGNIGVMSDQHFTSCAPG